MAELRADELPTAMEMARALRAREVSSEELVVRVIRNVERWQPAINAFSQLWADEALTEARRLDGLREPGGPFAGVPVAVKDLYDVAGHETTSCSAAYAGNVVATDAPVIAALRRAGLVIVGKTNQHELAAGGTNAVSACGPTQNPWDRARITGGSSGGSGAAIAAGVLPWALGSDTGGSIRIPAALCGTFGLKVTNRKLSTEGMLPLSPSLDTPGPMAATADDLAALYAIMAEQSPQATLPEPPSAGWRIGLVGGYFTRTTRPEILAVVRSVAELLGGVGARTEPVDGEGIDDVRSVWRRITYSEFLAAYSRLPPERYERIAPSVRSWMEQGSAYTPDDIADAGYRWQEIGVWFRERLKDVDALLVPTTPYWAPRHGEDKIDVGGEIVDLQVVTPGWQSCAANIAGLPAVSLPAGHSPEGLPFGVSLIGRADAEETLLALARLWEQAAAYTPTYPAL
jgi:aspartyl-tRNA(Asn)/glutamyl-tRNA(Gln) amidotransferase subunit A